MHIEGLAVLHNCVPSIVATLRSTAQLNVITQDIDNLSLAFVTPLRPKNDSGHCVVRLCYT